MPYLTVEEMLMGLKRFVCAIFLFVYILFSAIFLVRLKPFQDMDYLVADWITKTLDEHDHPQALLVLQLAQEFIKLVSYMCLPLIMKCVVSRHNSAFISTPSIKKLISNVCKRACRTMEPLTQECLQVLDCILKYRYVLL